MALILNIAMIATALPLIMLGYVSPKPWQHWMCFREARTA